MEVFDRRITGMIGDMVEIITLVEGGLEKMVEILWGIIREGATNEWVIIK